jgi:hypothetical protein
MFLSALALRGCMVREMMLQTSLKIQQQHSKRNQNAAEKTTWTVEQMNS